MNSDDRRESFRMASVSKAACYLTNESNRYTGTLRNLSMVGFFLETAEKPEVSQEYGVEIVLEGAHSRLVVDNLAGVVTRMEGDGVAVEFTEKFEWLALAPIFYQENKNG